MTLELKPDQQQLLQRAALAGMNPEDVIDQAFAVIRDQFEHSNWMTADRERIAAHIEEGFLQAERGEFMDGDEVIRVLKERHEQHRA